ncbi:VWA domain-containing protein [Microbacterium sp. YY-03]|uniref:VWA domain-containing protein n=1 Tax=Microbacterium sp. YY-03 TaxID=3421636 RepID=UPI003D16B93D
MTFQPVIMPILLVVLFAPLVFIVVRALITAKSARQRGLWSTRALLVALCFAMLLRPGIAGTPTQTVATNTDIYLVVDTTASIVAEDWGDGEPRLSGIRDDIAELVTEYAGARFSFITFASTAEVRLPLTTDSSAVMSSLAVMRPETTSVSRGSDIGAASATLERVLTAAAESTADRSRMVFYFGDGEQTSSRDPKSFVDSAELVDGGAVFGYGTTEGGPMKVTSGYATDSPDDSYIEYEGEIALSVLDEENLQTIADDLGIELQVRDAGSTVQFPAAPRSSMTLANSETAGGIFDLSWILAIAVSLIVAWELLRATMMTTQLRGLKATSRAEQRAEDEGSHV